MILSLEELENIKKKSFQEGYEEGHKIGYEEGYEQGVDFSDSCLIARISDLEDELDKYQKEGQRPQGKWLHPYTTNIACECSNCNLQLPITDYFNFCPNCGAYMRKGDED